MRLGLVASLLCLCTVSLSLADPAKAAIRKDLNVPPESLSPALQQVATTYELQVLYPTQVAKDLKTHGAVGFFTPDDALKAVLSGTGLSYKYLDANTVTVFSTAAPAGVTAAAGQDQTNTTQDNSKEAGKKSSQDFLVAQAILGQTSSASTVEKQDEKSSEKKKGEQLQEVVVTGSRIPLAAGQQSVQPVRGYTRDDIENSGQSTMGEFLNTLPDVSNFTQPSLQLGIAGVQTVQLHGLPVGTTLSLLDGRRVETSFLGLFDLSNIPVSAVERIEILPVGASAIYGADALGGAVNVILRKDFNGIEVNATLDYAPGVHDPGVNLAWGKSWERGSVSLIASYQEFGELLGTQREPTSLSQLPVSAPASTVLALGSDTCAPGNVYSTDGSTPLNGSNLPGLSSPYAGIPAGITGTPTIGQFAATAGKLNVCNSVRYNDITPWSQRGGALLLAHYEFAEAADLFTEVLLSHRDLRNQIGPQIYVTQSFGGTVAAGNPYNPFGQDVNVSFVYPGAGQQEVQSSYLIRPTIGVRGSLSSDWHYEATATLSQDRLHDDALRTDSTLVSAALASSNPATALNPFASGAPGSPQLLSSLIDPAIDTYDSVYNDRLVNAQAILRGPVLSLPAGPLQAVIGGEYSHEQEDTASSPFPGTRNVLHRNSFAMFGETRTPLLAGGTQPQPWERLTLTLAARYDHSDDFGGKATWQGGLLWRATETLSLNGTYGQSYRAPQLSEIAGPQTTFPSSLGYPDPFRGNELANYVVNFVSGPNYNLKAESGSSSSLGLAYTSADIHGLRASFTWYALDISNYIGIPNAQAILDNPTLFPGAVVRAPPTPQDVQQGFLGVVTQINDIYFNFGDLSVKGFDADVSYAMDTRVGLFTPSLAIANIYKWTSALTPNSPAIDNVSKATFSGFTGVGWAPRWKGTAALAWKSGPLSMNVAGRYVGSYLDYQTIPNTHETGDSWIIDASARYEVGERIAGSHSWLAHTYVALGVVNAFNKTPPFAYTSTWYDYSEYDVRGRFVHLNVGAKF
jgi:iron complex outermembrane receptor protein